MTSSILQIQIVSPSTLEIREGHFGLQLYVFLSPVLLDSPERRIGRQYSWLLGNADNLNLMQRAATSSTCSYLVNGAASQIPTTIVWRRTFIFLNCDLTDLKDTWIYRSSKQKWMKERHLDLQIFQTKKHLDLQLFNTTEWKKDMKDTWIYSSSKQKRMKGKHERYWDAQLFWDNSIIVCGLHSFTVFCIGSALTISLAWSLASYNLVYPQKNPMHVQLGMLTTR